MTARATISLSGDTAQVTLPKAFIERLGGHDFEVTEVEGAVKLTPIDQHARRMAIVEEIMRDHDDILRELAK